MRGSQEHVLGLHPSSRGFGWIFFEAPGSPFDWGVADIRAGGNEKVLSEVGELLTKYRPAALAMEAFEGTGSRRQPRIRELYRSIVEEAERRGIPVCLFSREESRQVFEGPGTRQDIADAVAKKCPPLRSRLPKPRKAWDSERSNMALFCAAACALVHFAKGSDGS